ncbi:MAG: Arsenical pump-driving ATPase [Myxococcaceae bacterium]|nr:Arsenical pump-driving ATPase [Myxococcaceae bacterium]
MSLSEVLAQHRVVVCVGSGGVGKTTTSAALAMYAAIHGRRVLCLTIDPAKRLANSLGLTSMTTEEQLVSPELFAAAGLVAEGTLSAMMLDTKRTFDELVEKYASSPERAKRIFDNKLYQYISTSLAGTQEYMAMEKLYSVRESQKYDLIVLDTPPTTNALDFLDAPEKLVDAIDSPAMRWFAQAFTGVGKIGFGLFGRGASMVLKGLAKFTGGEFLKSVSDFIGDINDLFGGFTERAKQVSSALRSPEVAFVLVTSPDPLAVQEAIFFAGKLAESGLTQRGTVINRVTPLLSEPPGTPKEVSAAFGLKVPADRDAGALQDKLERALDEDRLRAVTDRGEVERLKALTGNRGLYIEVPAFEQDVHDLGALARVASYLVG